MHAFFEGAIFQNWFSVIQFSISLPLYVILQNIGHQIETKILASCRQCYKFMLLMIVLDLEPVFTGEAKLFLIEFIYIYIYIYIYIMCDLFALKVTYNNNLYWSSMDDSNIININSTIYIVKVWTQWVPWKPTYVKETKVNSNIKVPSCMPFASLNTVPKNLFLLKKYRSIPMSFLSLLSHYWATARYSTVYFKCSHIQHMSFLKVNIQCHGNLPMLK